MKTNDFSITGIILCLVFSFFSLTAMAQTRPKQRPKINHRSYVGRDTTERVGALTVFPTNFVASTMKIGYEFRLSQNKGLKLIGTYGYTSSGYYGVNSFSEFGLEAQLRFYIMKDRPALNGLYMAPYAFYKSMHYNYNTVQYYYNGGPPTANATTADFNIGYVLGYQYIFNSTFTIDLFIGGGINSISGNNTNGSLGSDMFAYYKGIIIHPGIAIGIAF